MEEVTERGLAGHKAAGGQLLQPCRPTREAQARRRHVRLKTNRQTDTSVRRVASAPCQRGHHLEAPKTFAWDVPQWWDREVPELLEQRVI